MFMLTLRPCIQDWLLCWKDVTPFFMFELTPFPNSVFKNFQMTKTNKSVLKHYLTTDVPEFQPVTDTCIFRWKCSSPPRVTYNSMVAQYVSYVKVKYGPSSIIFYGYVGPSIKEKCSANLSSHPRMGWMWLDVSCILPWEMWGNQAYSLMKGDPVFLPYFSWCKVYLRCQRFLSRCIEENQETHSLRYNNYMNSQLCATVYVSIFKLWSESH